MSSVISILSAIQQYFTIALGVLLVIGVSGNILNCTVFLRKQFRSNPCALFFAAFSLVNIIVLIYYIIPTIYSTYNKPLENSNLMYCKLRLYIRNVLLVTSRTYLTLACISCYTISSRNVRMRNWFNSKNVIRILCIVPVIWWIIPLHILLLTDIQHGKCQMWISAAALYHSIYICLVAAILPTSLMIIFSLLAYENLRKMASHVQPLSTTREHNTYPLNENHNRQKRDRQLCKMLFVQIVVYMIFTISYPFQTIYNAIVLIIGGSKSAERAAIENFTLFITSSFLLNCYSSASFFVFLTSKTFRKELKQVFQFVLCLQTLRSNQQSRTQTISAN